MIKELVVIDGGSKVPPRPQSERSEASRLFHSQLTVRRMQEVLFNFGPTRSVVPGRRYAVIMRGWDCKAV